MNIPKTWAILLALLLVAMAIVPCVSAVEEKALSMSDASDRIVITPPPDEAQMILKTPLTESEMISFVFSEQWLEANNLDKNLDNIKVSVPKKTISKSQVAGNDDSMVYSVGVVDASEKVALLQIPKNTYDAMNPESASVITLDYPRYIFTFYSDAASLAKGIEQRRLIRTAGQIERTELNPGASSTAVRTTTSDLYAEWACYNTISGRTPVALRGDITPQTLTNQGQSFTIYHEREIYFNRIGDQIELTLYYTDNGNIYLSVPIYDEGNLYWGSNGVPARTWIDASSKNRFYYEVYIQNNGQYNINFLNTGTAIWYQYTYNDSDNPSTHIIGITGSSEMYLSSLTNAFQATTNTMRDYGVKDTLSGSWISPGSRFTWDQYKYDSIHNGLYVFMNSYIIGGTIYTYHDTSNTDI